MGRERLGPEQLARFLGLVHTPGRAVTRIYLDGENTATMCRRSPLGRRLAGTTLRRRACSNPSWSDRPWPCRPSRCPSNGRRSSMRPQRRGWSRMKARSTRLKRASPQANSSECQHLPHRNRSLFKRIIIIAHYRTALRICGSMSCVTSADRAGSGSVPRSPF